MYCMTLAECSNQYNILYSIIALLGYSNGICMYMYSLSTNMYAIYVVCPKLHSH